MKRGAFLNKILYCLACVLPIVVFASCASAPVAPMEDRSMQKIHDIDLAKNEIYDRSLEWMYQTFLDPKEVIDLRAKDEGMLIGKGILMFRGKIGWFSADIPCRFTLVLEAKDNKYRTTYGNFVGLWGENYSRPQPLEEKKYIDEVKAKLAIMDDALYDYMKKTESGTHW